MPDGSSPMIAPMTDAAAATRSDANRYGTDVGSRSFHSTSRLFAAYERISSKARGSAARSPRSAAIVTGKKVRYAETIATDSQPAFVATTMSGEIARIGTVCEATTYGTNARSASRE